MILTTHVMCGEFSQCYNDANICLWTDGAAEKRSEAQAECQKRNSSLPRVTNSDIQNKLAEFRTAADVSDKLLLTNSGFWIDVNTTSIDDFHWIDGSPLRGHFIYEFTGIVEIYVQYESNNPKTFACQICPCCGLPYQLNVWRFLPRNAMQSAVMPLYVVRPSVRLSVRLSVCPRCSHIGWNNSRIISRLTRLSLWLELTPTWAIWSNENTPKISVKWGWGHEHKTCNISEAVQDRTDITTMD